MIGGVLLALLAVFGVAGLYVAAIVTIHRMTCRSVVGEAERALEEASRERA